MIAAAKAARSATSVLPEADVAADEAVHRTARRHILQHAFDGVRLVLGLVIGEARAEFLVERFRRLQLGGLAREARGGDLDQLLRHVADALLHARLARLPAHTTELVELRLGVFRSVARQQFEIFDRQEQLVAARIVNLKAIVRRA